MSEAGAIVQEEGEDLGELLHCQLFPAVLVNKYIFFLCSVVFLSIE